MKNDDLLLLVGAAALIFLSKGSAAATDSGSAGSFQIPANLPKYGTPQFQTVGYVAGTTIPSSAGFQIKQLQAMKELGVTSSAALSKIATGQNLGTITVKQASTQPLSAEVAAAFKGYTGAIPSSVLSGKMTKSDIQLAKNILAKKK